MHIVYDRKSTDDADNQKNSLEYQRGANLRFAKREKLNIADLTIPNFCNAGIINERHSGFKEDECFEIMPNGTVQYKIERPKFLRLVGMLKNKEIKGAIFLCWDRASRNGQDDVIIKKLLKLGCDIRFSETTYEKSSSGDLHMDIDGMFSTHYSRVISEKVRNTNRKLRAEGKFINCSPTGYLDNGSGDKPIDPVRAPIVKRIFELYATGDWSVLELSKWANEQGLTTKPSRGKRTEDQILSNIELETMPKISRPVTHKTIEHILTNPFYIGQNRTKEGFIISTAHQPLIDTSLFNKVQEVLKARCVSVYYVNKKFATYRKLIRCTCGRAYCHYIRKGIGYYRLRCAATCNNPDRNLKESDIHASIQSLMDRMHFDDEELRELEVKARSGIDAITIKRNKELDDLHNQEKRVYADLDYLTKNRITLLRTNSMSIEDAKTEENRLMGQLNEIRQKAGAYGEAAQEMLKYVTTFSELIKRASLYYKFALDNEKRDIAAMMFTELTFNNKKLVDFKGKDGFEALLRRKKLTGDSTGNRTPIPALKRPCPNR